MTSLRKKGFVPTFPLFPEEKILSDVRERVSVRERASERVHVEIDTNGNNGNKGTSIESPFQLDETLFPSRSQTEPEGGDKAGTWANRPVFEREALEVSIWHLAFLAPVSFILAVPGLKAGCVWTWSKTRHGEAQRSGEPVFSPLEVEALAMSFEQGRYLSADLTDASVRKLREPGWRIGELVACHGLVPRVGVREAWGVRSYAGCEALGVHPHEMPHGVSVGRLTAAYGARVVSVEIEEARVAA